jgi:hypothetical protein
MVHREKAYQLKANTLVFYEGISPAEVWQEMNAGTRISTIVAPGILRMYLFAPEKYPAARYLIVIKNLSY